MTLLSSVWSFLKKYFFFSLLYTKIELFKTALGHLDLIFGDISDESSQHNIFKEYISAKDEKEAEKKLSSIFHIRQHRERQWSTGAAPRAKCSISNALNYYYSALPQHTELQGSGGAAPAERIKFNCSL